MFGKKGRPPEDRLARQREIYLAVAPLLLRTGARQLSMQQAAQAANLSIGGLYHYFPTKRELVLHGLCPAALLRYCEEFHAQFGHLAEQDSRRYLDEGIRVVTQHVRFCQPAIHAALELGVESFWEVVDTLLASSVLDFEVNLQRLAPAADQGQLQRCGRAIRHSICAALLDKSMSPDELGETLHILVDSYVNRMQVAPPVHRSLAA